MSKLEPVLSNCMMFVTTQDDRDPKSSNEFGPRTFVVITEQDFVDGLKIAGSTTLPLAVPHGDRDVYNVYLRLDYVARACGFQADSYRLEDGPGFSVVRNLRPLGSRPETLYMAACHECDRYECWNDQELAQASTEGYRGRHKHSEAAAVREVSRERMSGRYYGKLSELDRQR